MSNKNISKNTIVWIMGNDPKSFCQKLLTALASVTTSSTVFLISMKDVLASLYSLHPCLIAATQALAAKRMLSGSISHLYLTYGVPYAVMFASDTKLPDESIDAITVAPYLMTNLPPDSCTVKLVVVRFAAFVAFVTAVVLI